MNMAALLADVARRIPDNIAVLDGDREIRFSELFLSAKCMAGAMRNVYGVKPGDRVAIFLDNCSEFFEIIFAAWTIGACIVPINAKLHENEVFHILEDSGARICFTSFEKAATLHKLLENLDELEALIEIGGDAYAALYKASPATVQHARPEEPAWLFYTSGTTGKPKGAELSFRSLLFMTQCYYSDINLPVAGDTKLHAAPLSHGSGLYSLAHIFKGGCQRVLRGFTPSEIFAEIERHPNVTMFAAPTMITRLLNAPEAKEADLSNLQVLYFGGGPMYQSDLIRALELFGERLFHLFGQGESPMTISGFWPQHSDKNLRPEIGGRLTSCGIRRTGVDFRVVDEEGNEVTAGEIGEVITRSDCLMTGYWRNPEATKKAMPGGWLWTGDIGTYDDEGYLYLKDRSKDLIISGGTNIYPREIEDVLLTHPDISECSIVGRPHPIWGEEVVAFLVMKPDRICDTEALDQHIMSRIARFKRPKDYRILDNLPKNNYGKVVKTELRAILRKEED